MVGLDDLKEHKSKEFRRLGVLCRNSKRLLNPAASGPGLHLSQLWFRLSYKYAKVSFFKKTLLDAD
ncbi:hypothetical protein QYF61_011143, partial [Mycteria americana]